jgi:hypothetical protein
VYFILGMVNNGVSMAVVPCRTGMRIREVAGTSNSGNSGVVADELLATGPAVACPSAAPAGVLLPVPWPPDESHAATVSNTKAVVSTAGMGLVSLLTQSLRTKARPGNERVRHSAASEGDAAGHPP